MSAPEKKHCCGYFGHWACADKYPDHLLPVEKFGPHSGSQDGLQAQCRSCVSYRDSKSNPLRNAISARAIEKAGGRAAYDALHKRGKERKALRAEAKAEILAESSLSLSPITAAITEHSSSFEFPATDPEPVFSNSKKKIKTTTEQRERDQKVVRWVQKRYSACSIEGCGFEYFQVAHIHALRNDDADDLPNNCLALCPNHHWQLDHQKLRLVDYEDRTPDDPIFVLWADGTEGIINLGDGHTVENSNIEKGMRCLDEYFAKKRGKK